MIGSDSSSQDRQDLSAPKQSRASDAPPEGSPSISPGRVSPGHTPSEKTAPNYTVWLAAALALISVAQIWDAGRSFSGIDFYQFWVGAQMAGRPDIENFYDPETGQRLGTEFLQRAHFEEDSALRRSVAQQRPRLDLFSTPFLYTTFRLFALGGYDDDYWRFRFVSLASLVGSVLVLGRLLALPTSTIWLSLVAFTVAFQPLRADIRAANVNQLQLAGVTLFLWLQHRPGNQSRFLAGVTLGLLIAFKPNLAVVGALLAISWIFERRFRELLRIASGAAAGSAAAVLVSSWAFGSVASWGQWLHKLQSIPPSILPLEWGNFGLSRLLMETADLELTRPLAFFLGLVALASLALAHRKTFRTTLAAGEGKTRSTPTTDRSLLGHRDTVGFSLATLVTFLSSPLVWQHYLVLAIPAILVLWSPLFPSGSWIRTRGVLALLTWSAIAISPFTILFGIEALIHQAILVNCGLALLFGLLIWRVFDLARHGSGIRIDHPEQWSLEPGH